MPLRIASIIPLGLLLGLRVGGLVGLGVFGFGLGPELGSGIPGLIGPLVGLEGVGLLLGFLPTGFLGLVPGFTVVPPPGRALGSIGFLFFFGLCSSRPCMPLSGFVGKLGGLVFGVGPVLGREGLFGFGLVDISPFTTGPVFVPFGTALGLGLVPPGFCLRPLTNCSRALLPLPAAALASLTNLVPAGFLGSLVPFGNLA